MFYVFIGQNATCGTPHQTTGKLNMYGELKAFNTRKERDQFYDNYNNNDGFTRCYKTNKKAAKSKFYAGLSQLQYDDYLRYVDNDYLDSDF